MLINKLFGSTATKYLKNIFIKSEQINHVFKPSNQRYGKISDIVEKTKIEYKNNFEEW